MGGVRRLACVLGVLPVLLTACPGASDGPPPAGGEHAIVVGVQGEQLAGAIGSVHVVTKIDEITKSDERVAASALPKEVLVDGPAGSNVDVLVEAFPAGAPPDAPPIVTRHATARIPAAKKLLRVQLDPRCVTSAGQRSGGPPPCAPSETCVSGRCVAPAVADADLETYDPGWPSAPPDACRPANHGAPEVIIGTGQTDYAPLADGQVLKLEKGPQGGHHIWIAVRMKNLRQSGSTSMITSKIVGDPQEVPPAAYVFTFDRDEGGYCKLWGLRYQVDVGAPDLGAAYKRFLGKKLEVTVQVTDSTKATATSTRTIQIDDKLLCPDGTDSCNTP
jgi:hypothetical protein